MIDDFDAWYAELRPQMLPALSAWCGHAGLADEALDEAFTRAFERWTRVAVAPSPAGWVWRTATNVVRRQQRRRAIELRLLRRTAARAVVDANRSPHSAHGHVADDLDLRAALSRLTQRQRTAVVLHHIADLPHVEVAAAMGVATGTVAATLHQARARLAADLGARADVDPRTTTPPLPCPTDGATP